METKASLARIELIPLRELLAKEWSRNPKKHDLAAIRKSIRRFGFTIPIALDETSDRIVAGHGRLHSLAFEAANNQPPPKRIEVAENGDWLVPTLLGISFESEAEAEAYLVADNQTTIAGGWDRDSLKAIVDDGVDLEGLGFGEGELSRILEGEKKREVSFQAFSGNEKKTVVCPQCGFHVSVEK